MISSSRAADGIGLRFCIRYSDILGPDAESDSLIGNPLPERDSRSNLRALNRRGVTPAFGVAA